MKKFGNPGTAVPRYARGDWFQASPSVAAAGADQPVDQQRAAVAVADRGDDRVDLVARARRAVTIALALDAVDRRR